VLRRGWALAAALAALLVPASAAAGADYLSHCNGNGYCAVVSQDGSRVVFPFQEELTRGAGEGQIYEWSGGADHPLLPPRDREQAPSYANLLATSADASHVFVQTGEPLSQEDRDGTGSDVYDLHAGSPTLVSTGPLDPQAGTIPDPSLMSFGGASPDGSHVYFDSLSPLVASDTDNCRDVYERYAGQTTQVSTGPTATPSYPPGRCDSAGFSGVSADGSHVFFYTYDSLVPEDEDLGPDIYERVGGVVRPLTTYPPASQGCVDIPRFGDSSADGRTVLFSTTMPVSPEDEDNQEDIYKREPDGSFVLVSRGADSGSEPGACGGFAGDSPVALSADGRTAIFSTPARLSPADVDSSNDLYRADPSGVLSLISTGPTDPGTDERQPPPPQRTSAVSEDAQRVAFVSRARLVPEDRDDAIDVYLRSGDRTQLISTGPRGGDADRPAHLLGMSADGRTIAFGTGEALTSSDLDHRIDFYLWREGAPQPRLITAEEIAPRLGIAAHGRLRRDGRLGLRLACPAEEVSGPCLARVVVRSSRRSPPLGRGKFRVPAGRRRWVAVPLRKRAPRPRHAVLVVVRGSDRAGNERSVRRRVKLSGSRRR
jgi:hypothetical protein